MGRGAGEVRVRSGTGARGNVQDHIDGRRCEELENSLNKLAKVLE